MSIKSLEAKIKFLENKIKRYKQNWFVDRFLQGQRTYKMNTIIHYKTINTNKFNALKQHTFRKLKFSTSLNNNWLINLTDIDIPEDICWLLSLGPKFALPIEQKDFPIFQFIADIENILWEDTDDESREAKRSKVSHILHKEKYTNPINDPIKAEIVSIHKKTQKFLNQNKDLLVTSADKGNRTVIMLKSDYDRKMMDLLSDGQVYRKLDYDTTDSLHERIIYIANSLKKQKFISEEETDDLIMHNSSVPKVYGQPKVHKRGNPLRLIVASYESPAYKTALFLTTILSNLTANSKYNVSNASKFIKRVRNLKFSAVCKMVSFDVVSLFTNIPLDLVEQIIDDRWNEIQQYTTIPKREFMQLLNFVTRDCNQFSYNNTMYKQIDGLPMGLPLSPILADLVMEYVLDQATRKLNFELQECVKYVDDLFLIIPSSMLTYTINTFNSVHHKIQFTYEDEKNNVLSFLDVLLIHETDDTIAFDWYSKPTSSGRVLNYFSNHPLNHKLNVMDNLIKRLLELSSNKFHWKNTKLAKSLLLASGYPICLIEQRIKRFYGLKRRQSTLDTNVTHHNNTQNNSATKNSQQSTPPHYKGLQFNESCSQNIGKILCRGIEDLKLGFKPSSKNRSNFSKLKQKTPKTEMYDVVYQIPCIGDGRGARCNLKYTGQTGRKIKVRTEEHDIKTYNKNGELDGTTALVHHFYDTGHAPDMDNISILEVEHSYTKRKTLESLHILSNQSMNFRKDTENISAVYKSLTKEILAPSS